MLGLSRHLTMPEQDDASNLTEQLGKWTLNPLELSGAHQTQSDGAAPLLTSASYTPALNAQKQTPLQRKTAEVLKDWEYFEELIKQNEMFNMDRNMFIKQRARASQVIMVIEDQLAHLAKKEKLSDRNKVNVIKLNNSKKKYEFKLNLSRRIIDFSTREIRKNTISLEERLTAQVTSLTHWLLLFQHNLELTPEASSKIHKLIAKVRCQLPTSKSHPSDSLFYLAIFHQLIGPALKKTKGKKQSIKELFVYETAAISYALTLKVMGDNNFWLSDLTYHINSDYYSPIFHALEYEASNELQTYLTTYRGKNPNQIHSRFKLLESKALCHLDFNVIYFLPIKEQANIIAKLQLCEEHSRMSNADIDTNDGLKQAYLEMAQDAVQSLDNVFPQRRADNVKATFKFEMKL